MIHRTVVSVVLLALLSITQAEHAPSIANTAHALRAQHSWLQTQYLFFSCSIFPYSFAPECSRIDPPLRAFQASDFIAEGYLARQHEAISWIVAPGLTARLGTLTAMIGGMNQNLTTYCTTYSFGRVSTVRDFFTVAQRLTNYSYRSMTGAFTAFTSRNQLQGLASLSSAHSNADAVLNMFLGNIGITPVRFDFPMSFNESLAAFSAYQVNCSNNTPLTPYTVGPLRRAQLINGGTSFTGPLSAQFNMRYTDSDRARDLVTLNFLLTVHRLHAAMFNEAVSRFTVMDYQMMGISGGATEWMVQMAANEQVMADTIVTLITQLTGSSSSVAPPCTYDFRSYSWPVVFAFFAVAKPLIGTSLGVEISATKAVVNTDLQQILGTFIHYESQQFTYLTLLLTGWSGQEFQTGLFGMGMESAQVMGMTIDPDLWLSRLPTSISMFCPTELAIPQGVPSDEVGQQDEDEVPIVELSSSTGLNYSSTGIDLTDEPNSASLISVNLIMTIAWIASCLLFV